MDTENNLKELIYEYTELIRRRTDNDYVPELASRINELFMANDIKQLLYDLNLMRTPIQIKIGSDEQKEYVLLTKDLWDDTLKFYGVK